MSPPLHCLHRHVAGWNTEARLNALFLGFSLVLLVLAAHGSAAGAYFGLPREVNVAPCTSRRIFKNHSHFMHVRCHISDEIMSIVYTVQFLSHLKADGYNIQVYLTGDHVGTFTSLAPYHHFGNLKIGELMIIGKVITENITNIQQMFISQHTSLTKLRIGGRSTQRVGLLTGVPWKATRILSSLETLDLRWNDIQTVKSGDLTGLIALQTLDLSHNKITHLHPSCFVPVAISLTMLDLSDNKLANLSVTPFMPMTALKILRLVGNQLPSLPENLLSNISSLTFLDVRDNRLNSVGPLNGNGTSDVGPKCQIIDVLLDNNEIETLAAFAFSRLANLTSVYLGNNRITVLKAASFDRLPELMELYIGTNLIHSIEPGFFDTLPSLKKLELWDNNLLTLDQDVFSFIWTELDVLDAGDNHFKCDCSILWVYTSLHANGTKGHPEELLMYCTNLKQKQSYDVTTIDRANINCQP